MIIVEPDLQEPSTLATSLSEKYGLTVAFSLCRREMLIAAVTENAQAIEYWTKVAAALPVEAQNDNNKTLPVNGTSQEGARLITIFSRIASAGARQRLLDFAIELLRQDPL